MPTDWFHKQGQRQKCIDEGKSLDYKFFITRHYWIIEFEILSILYYFCCDILNRRTYYFLRLQPRTTSKEG